MDGHRTLVLLAAGVGRRYGGPKQTEPVGPSGEWLLEYSLFDALRAGFSRAVVVVHPSLEPALRARLDAGAGRRLPYEFAFQAEPRGTAHALLKARGLVRGPFAVANADDVYGPLSFELLARALDDDPASWALVGFEVSKTLSPHGPVSRALVSVDASGRVLGLVEHPEVESGDGLASMNLWGFHPDVFEPLASGWREHEEHSPGAEFQLPTVVGALLAGGEASVRVVPTPESWLGVTWSDDRDWVAARLREAAADGRYPTPLWGTP